MVVITVVMVAVIVAVAFAIEGFDQGWGFVAQLFDDLFSEVVVAAAVNDHDVGLLDQELVFRGGFIRVRVLRRIADDAGDVAVITRDARCDIAVDVGGCDDVELISGVFFRSLLAASC